MACREVRASAQIKAESGRIAVTCSAAGPASRACAASEQRGSAGGGGGGGGIDGGDGEDGWSDGGKGSGVSVDSIPMTAFSLR